MTLVQLEYIVALDNLKHFAKAAAQCYITQPSLSMQVQKLEEELAVKSLCLHAWKLSFDSPGTNARVDVKAPVPASLKEVLVKLKMQIPE